MIKNKHLEKVQKIIHIEKVTVNTSELLLVGMMAGSEDRWHQYTVH